MNVRRAAEADLPAVAALEKALFPDAWPLRELTESFHRPQYRFYVAEGPERIRGYLIASAGPGEGELLRVGTEPESRRRGIGRALTMSWMEEARGRGEEEFFLEVRFSNAAAQALYRSCGFAAVGRRKNYYRDPAEDALLMRAPAVREPDR